MRRQLTATGTSDRAPGLAGRPRLTVSTGGATVDAPDHSEYHSRL
jgi:hypothetical protein